MSDIVTLHGQFSSCILKSDFVVIFVIVNVWLVTLLQFTCSRLQH